MLPGEDFPCSIAKTCRKDRPGPFPQHLGSRIQTCRTISFEICTGTFQESSPSPNLPFRMMFQRERRWGHSTYLWVRIRPHGVYFSLSNQVTPFPDSKTDERVHKILSSERSPFSGPRIFKKISFAPPGRPFLPRIRTFHIVCISATL